MSLKFFAINSLVLLFLSCSPNDKILLIANKKANCTGVAPQKCLQIKNEGEIDWTYLYSDIEGFDYVEGFYYRLKVNVSEVENPPADGSSLKYYLVEILEKSRAPLNIDQGSWLVTRVKDRDSFARNPFIKIDLSQNVINGNTSCNRFSANIEVTDNQVDITELSSTEMMCRDIEVETLFLDAMARIASYTLKNDKLQLLDINKELLIECTYLKSE
ncbi:DUF4377 domain-containing protein [Gelidibacter maritimus]|uniref:DUF4377 domain-containing protein n=1 Tax=Gelidibacter maritimus TaxID=2761487 RepID=A0A7W2M306_9FLAO|nr:DUF4377 domain-containing protein [Gelidibacter maritimus]MBA6151774.1 DUF4377 domain-containing protein [Gelidibacter maritimus]